MLDLLSTLLKKTDKNKPEFDKIIEIFPKLIEYIKTSDDMFLLLHGTMAIKNFIFYGHEAVLKVSSVNTLLDTTKRLLSPQRNE